MRWHRPVVRGMVILALLAISPTVRADTPASPSEAEQARSRYEQGRKHYELGEFVEALSDFKEAYRLKREPALLFNLGQASRWSGAKKEARFYFGQYLNARPDAKNAAEVRELIADLDAQLAAGAAPTGEGAAPGAKPLQTAEPVAGGTSGKTTSVPAAALAARSGTESAAEQPKKGEPGKKWTGPTGYAAAGLGLALCGLAGYQAIHASSLVSDANAAADANGGYYKSSDLEKISSARLASRAEKISLGLGAVLVAVGVVLVFAF